MSYNAFNHTLLPFPESSKIYSSFPITQLGMSLPPHRIQFVLPVVTHWNTIYRADCLRKVILPLPATTHANSSSARSFLMQQMLLNTET